MSPNQQFAHKFSSAEQFSEVVGSTQWELDFRQLSRGQIALPTNLIHGTSSLWLKVQASALLHQRAVPPPGHVTIGLVDNAESSAKFDAHELDWNELTLFNPATGIDCVSGPGFSAYTISFPLQRLISVAQRLELACPGDDPASRGHRACEAEDMTRLRWLLAEFNKVMFTGNDELRSNALANAEAEIPALLVQAWNRGMQSRPERGNNRRRALTKALDYIEANPHTVIRVEQLCQAAACSVSTLERAFGEHFGIPPKRYLLAIRLSAVRRQLLEYGQSRTIGDIAADWGFWHMSKFAQDYRIMFGERPSATRAAVRTGR
jgi:AraC family ethanolamine operon transcriptional activator